MEEQAKIRFLIRTAYFVTVAVGTVLLCRFIFAYFMPFLAGILTAWAVQRPAAFFERKTGMQKRIAAPVLAVSLFLIAAFLLSFGLYKGGEALAGLVSDLSKKLPEITNALSRMRNGAAGFFSRLPKEAASAAKAVYSGAAKRLPDLLTNAVSSTVTALVKRTPVFLFHTVVALAASCYIAVDFEKLTRFLKGVIGKAAYEKLSRIKEICKESVFKLLKGYFLLSVITLVLLWIGFLILRIRHGLIAAVLIAAIDFLPVLGTGVVLIPWGIASLFLADIRTGAGLLILYAGIALTRYFSEPKVVGKQTGINPLFMLAAMFAGLKCLGGPGFFLAPMALIVTVEYYKQDLRKEKSLQRS